MKRQLLNYFNFYTVDSGVLRIFFDITKIYQNKSFAAHKQYASLFYKNNLRTQRSRWLLAYCAKFLHLFSFIRNLPLLYLFAQIQYKYISTMSQTNKAFKERYIYKL